GRVVLDGRVRGYALISAGRTEINGRVDGDVRVVSGELVLGPEAVVQGRLDYHAGAPLRQAPGAQVLGGIHGDQGTDTDAGSLPVMLLLAWIAGWVLAGAALLALAPQASRRVTQALRTRPALAPL